MRWFLSRAAPDVTEPEEPKPSVLTRLSADITANVALPQEALRHFEGPSITLPPSSRVGDPKVKQRQNRPMRLWELWKYGAFAAMKGVFFSLGKTLNEPSVPTTKSSLMRSHPDTLRE